MSVYPAQATHATASQTLISIVYHQIIIIKNRQNRINQTTQIYITSIYISMNGGASERTNDWTGPHNSKMKKKKRKEKKNNCESAEKALLGDSESDVIMCAVNFLKNTLVLIREYT